MFKVSSLFIYLIKLKFFLYYSDMFIMKLLVLFVLISFFLNFNFSHAASKNLLTTKTIKDLVEKNNKVKEAGGTAGHYKSDGSLKSKEKNDTISKIGRFFSSFGLNLKKKGDTYYLYNPDGSLKYSIKEKGDTYYLYNPDGSLKYSIKKKGDTVYLYNPDGSLKFQF